MIRLRQGTAADAPVLAQMNRQLIDDERAENDMTLAQLEERMCHFMATSYRAYLIFDDGQVVGYILCAPQRTPLYIRHFFITRENRRKGYGTRAMALLREMLHVHDVDLDVLVWNKRGIDFYQHIGFEPLALHMRYRQKHEESPASL